MKPSLLGVVSALGIWQGIVEYKQNIERQSKYEMARASANFVGKPLLVVGGPYGEYIFRHIFKIPASHGYGDVCLDINPQACQENPDDNQQVIADVKKIPFSDRYFGAAFASHVLEHLPTIADAERAINELYRVADAVFIASPSKFSVGGWLVPGHHLWVKQLSDNTIEVEQR